VPGAVALKREETAPMRGAAEEVLGGPLPARVNRPRHEWQLGGPGCETNRWSAVVGEAEVRGTVMELPVVGEPYSAAAVALKVPMKGVVAEAPVGVMAPPTREEEEPALQVRAGRRWTACESWEVAVASSQ
jgi:hypothetical protein